AARRRPRGEPLPARAPRAPPPGRRAAGGRPADGVLPPALARRRPRRDLQRAPRAEALLDDPRVPARARARAAPPARPPDEPPLGARRAPPRARRAPRARRPLVGGPRGSDRRPPDARRGDRRAPPLPR